ncbi:MAG: Beta-galactosidase C-terminal domain, partial [Bacteroidota bacterium]
YGEGAVYYLGTFGEPAFYRDLVAEILPGTDMPAIPGLPEGVDAVWREKESRRYLFLINLTGEERTVPIPGGARVQLGEAPRDGVVTLPGYGVGVYRLAHQ